MTMKKIRLPKIFVQIYLIIYENASMYVFLFDHCAKWFLPKAQQFTECNIFTSKKLIARYHPIKNEINVDREKLFVFGKTFQH